MRAANRKEGEEIRGAVCVRVCLCGKEREGEREDGREISILKAQRKRHYSAKDTVHCNHTLTLPRYLSMKYAYHVKVFTKNAVSDWVKP